MRIFGLAELFVFAEVTNNGRPMNPSLSEDSVADTAISKRNSDGMNYKFKIVLLFYSFCLAVVFVFFVLNLNNIKLNLAMETKRFVRYMRNIFLLI